MTTIKTITADTIAEAANILRGGGIVAIPTETVYGLAGNALDGKAIARIYEAKGRPPINPLIIHCADTAQAETLVDIPSPPTPPLAGGGHHSIPPPASGGEEPTGSGGEHPFHILAARFWPGPLTFILPRAKNCAVSELATAGLETIAVRVPAHSAARDLITACGFPLAAPSANASGTITSTTPAHVAETLGDKIDMILAGGKTTVGLESTVLDLTGERPVILRPGAITAQDIMDACGIEVSYHAQTPDAPKSPGQLLRHYAPSIPIRLNAVDVRTGEALLGFGSLKFMGHKNGGFAKDVLPDTALRNLSESGDLHEAAANLFSMLKELDRPENKSIAVMNVPNTGLGIAINDRLTRAADSTKQ